MLRSTLSTLGPEQRQDLPEQALLFGTQSVPGRKQIGELVLSSDIDWNKAHLQTE